MKGTGMIQRFFLAVTILLFTAMNASMALAQMVSVKGAKVNMRSGPGKNHAILWELGRGYPLLIFGQEGNWLKVKDFEGDTGWIYKTLISDKPHLIVKKKRINLRSGPGTKYKIVGQANYGVVLATLGQPTKGWVKVKHDNGLSGWTKRDLLWGW